MSVTNAVKLPEQVSDEAASLAVLGRVALRGVRRAAIAYGDCVAVVGMGVMGQLAMQHARLAGAAQTVAVDIEPWRLEVAGRLGASDLINSALEDPADRILACSAVGADVVIETAGAPSAVPVAFKLAKDRGRVVMVGWHLKPVELLLGDDFFRKELEVLASRAKGPLENLASEAIRWTSQTNLEFVVDLLRDGRISAEVW